MASVPDLAWTADTIRFIAEVYDESNAQRERRAREGTSSTQSFPDTIIAYATRKFGAGDPMAQKCWDMLTALDYARDGHRLTAELFGSFLDESYDAADLDFFLKARSIVRQEVACAKGLPHAGSIASNLLGEACVDGEMALRIIRKVTEQPALQRHIFLLADQAIANQSQLSEGAYNQSDALQRPRLMQQKLPGSPTSSSSFLRSPRARSPRARSPNARSPRQKPQKASSRSSLEVPGTLAVPRTLEVPRSLEADQLLNIATKQFHMAARNSNYSSSAYIPAATAGKKIGTEDANVSAQRARPGVVRKLHNTNWTISEWIKSLNLHVLIANTLAKHFAADSAELQLSFLKKLANNGRCEDVEKILLDGHILHILGDEILKGSRSLESDKAESAEQPSDKFQLECGLSGVSNGSVPVGIADLEGRIGSPGNCESRTIEDAMRREHCEWADSTPEFTSSNYKVQTTSKAEWYFVTNPEDGPQQEDIADLKLEAWPVEAQYPDSKAEKCRLAKPLDDPTIQGKLKELNAILKKAGEALLSRDEVCGLRLFTGPMCMKYNSVLRADIDQSMWTKWEALCLGNKYVTTLHVINSGIVKCSKAMRATTVYRGIQGGLVPEGFWKPNEFNVLLGGVEYAFMSTSRDLNVAMDYAPDGDFGSTILEIKMGNGDRGADLSWISQYPHEQEICYSPLTGFEVMSTRVEGSVLVVQVRPKINLTSRTLEEVLEKRKAMIAYMCENLKAEVASIVGGPVWKELAAEVNVAQIPKLVHGVVMEQLTKVADRPPADFYNDETMQEAMQTAIGAVAKARQQRAEIIEAAAMRINTEKMAKGSTGKVWALAAAYFKDEGVVEDVIVNGGAPYGDIKFVQGSCLDLLGLKLSGSNIELAKIQTYKTVYGPTCNTLLAQWTRKQQAPFAMGWRLVKVDGERGGMLEKLSDIYSDGKDHRVVLTFQRPMAESDVKECIIKVATGARDGTADRNKIVRHLRRVMDMYSTSSLDLIRTELGAQAGLALAKALEINYSVSKLILSETGLGEQAGLAFATMLETNASIKTLGLDGNGLGEQVGLALAKALEINSSVKELYAGGNGFGEKTGLAFAKVLQINSSINTLGLDDNGIGEKAGLAVANALFLNISVNKLILHNAGLGGKAGLAFAKVLETNSRIINIGLDDNAFGEQAGLAFGKALEFNSSIEELVLSGNDFGQQAGLAFAKALQTNSFIKTLGLSGNSLGKKAGVAFAKALEANCSINTLFLDDNGFGPQAGVALAEALKANSSINALVLSSNDFGEPGGVAFANALETNSSVNALYLDDNDFGEQAGLAFAKALEANSHISALVLTGNDFGEKADEAFTKTVAMAEGRVQVDKLQDAPNAEGMEDDFEARWSNQDNSQESFTTMPMSTRQ